MSFAHAEVKTATKTPEKRASTVYRMRKEAFRGTNSPVDRIMQIQEAVGNQAVQELLKSRFIRAKLKISMPNDVYEQEADRVADAIMHLPELKLQQEKEREAEVYLQPFPTKVTSLIQKQYEKENDILQEKTSFNTRPEATNEQENRIQAVRESGQPLSREDQNLYESFFNGDLSAVRVHTDSNAAQLARELDAMAFTIGQDVVFGDGNYSPETSEGRRLLAHELTHVIQQGGDKIQSKSVTKHTGKSILQLQRRRTLRQSKTVPDLDDATVKELEIKWLTAKGATTRQEIIDTIVSDRKKKGVDFTIMDGEKPKYVNAFPKEVLEQGGSPEADGFTVQPKKEGEKPQVLIGPKAFRTLMTGLVESQRSEMFANVLVHLYSSMMHEYQHAVQWKKPKQREAIGKPGREVEAFFWEIENSEKTGLSKQWDEFKSVWDEATEWWQKFNRSPEWGKLGEPEKRRYEDRHKRVSEIAKEILK
jgi:hypothetical protein